MHAFRIYDDQFSHPELVSVLARQAALAIEFRQVSGIGYSVANALHELELLNELALSALDLRSISGFLQDVTRRVVGASACGVMLVDPSSGTLHLLPGAFGVDEIVAASYQISIEHPTSNAARAFASGEPYMTNDPKGDPGILQDYVEALGVEQLITVPLQIGGNRIGVFHVANKAGGFTLEDVNTVQAIAPRVAAVAEFARITSTARRSNEAEMALAEVAIAVASGRSLTSFLEAALARLRLALDATAVGFVSYNSTPVVSAAQSVSHEHLESAIRGALSDNRPSADLEAPRGAHEAGFSAIFEPVELQGSKLGAMFALRGQATSFSAAERSGVERMAKLIALSWTAESYLQQQATLARLSERQRLADDIHDNVAQMLYVAQVNLDVLLDEPAQFSAPTVETLRRVRSLLVRGDASIREVINGLSDPQPSPWKPASGW